MLKILISQLILGVAVQGSTTSKLFEIVPNVDATDWLATNPMPILFAR
jgi:hypothetical protein